MREAEFLAWFGVLDVGTGRVVREAEPLGGCRGASPKTSRVVGEPVPARGWGSRIDARIRDLKEMTWRDAERSDGENTVVMVACGPVEQHGPQTPLGTDLYMAEYVMRRCAEHLADHGYPVIVPPTVPYVNALFSLPWLRLYPAQDRRGVPLRSARLVRRGRLSAPHARQPARGPSPYRAADGVCERVNEEYGARAVHGFERLVADILEDSSPLDLPGLDPRGESHAGVYETAPMLYLREHLVRKRIVKELPPMPIEFSQMEGAESFRELGNGLGYTGDPSRATAEVGERIVGYYADRFKDLMLRHMRGEDVYGVLRFSGF